MSDAEFDRYAADYRELHARNIELSGEEPEYFADYKMRDFARLVQRAHLPLDGTYLDFGSGVGASIRPFQRHLAGARLICADVSKESLELSQAKHGQDAEYLLLHAGKLPLPDASMAGAFVCCVFHHIARDAHRDVLAELRRVIKPGGLLMIYEHNPLNPLTVRAVRTCPLDINAILISAHTMQRRCEGAGFVSSSRSFRVFFPAALASLRPVENWLRWLPLGAQYYVTARA